MIISVLSYNIHRAIGIDRRFRPERIIRVLQHHRPDVVLLQEVDHQVPRSKNTEMARELAVAAGYPYFALGLNVSLRRGQYGNATMSRFPMAGERNIDLTIAGSKRRGCLNTPIAVPRGGGAVTLIHVFNLHLGLSAQERSRQVGLLVRSKEFSSVGPEDRCIVGGDFNDWRNLLLPIFEDILNFNRATTGTRRGFFSPGLATFPSFSPSGELDRIYWRGPLRFVGGRRCRLQVSRIASDHLPVIARFEL